MNLRIGPMLYGGTGLATAGGEQVPFTLPGELVAIEPPPAAPAILEPSPDRIAPLCPHFGPCGGCHYQHASYEAQLRIKTTILHDILVAAGLPALPTPQLHAAHPWEYRNRIRVRLARVDGTLRPGYNRRGSYTFLPIETCPIAAPLLLRAAEALCNAPAPWAAILADSEAELFCTPGQAALQITLFLRADPRSPLATLCGHLRPTLPELTGAGTVITGPSGRREQPGPTWGAPGLTYIAAGRPYWVTRGGFFQVNRFLVDTLVTLVTAGRSGRLAWDLYAGVGLFSRALTGTFAEVVGVETAATGLSAVLKSPPHRAVSSTTLDFLRAAVLQRDRPDLIVMDPPRAGLGPEVTALLARIQCPQIVYVSCDPTTLARDLNVLAHSGYTVTALHLVDLFPQTFHLETVVSLHR